MTIKNQMARLGAVAVWTFLTIGCGKPAPQARDSTAAASQCGADARQTIDLLGHRMRSVSLLAPDSVIRRELRDAYETLVTAAMLDQWQRSPADAPGRRTSNPWPARIDVDSITAEDDGCRVDGAIVFVTTADTMTPVDRTRVTLRVHNDNGWRVTAYAAATAPTASIDSSSPAAVIRSYYAAIDGRNYEAAYELWGRRGAASAQTRSQFEAGFARTAHVKATIGDSVRIEGAAGSQYATVPVVVDAVLASGERQRFVGSYTLRRAMVDGATADQRRWHIESAELHRA
jgi:hypothetical protein